MFHDVELIERSAKVMRSEMEKLLGEAARDREESQSMLKEAQKVRSKSVDLRSADPEMAESLWEEAERLYALGKDLLRESVDKTLKAGDIKRRLDIHDQIEATFDYADELWKGAIKAKRS